MSAPVESGSARVPAALLADLDEALRAEFGARAIDLLLARSSSDAELARLFATLAEEQDEQLARLQSLITELGGRARTHCRRRSVLARLLHATRFVGGRTLTLRLCLDAAGSLEYRYLGCGRYFAATGALGLAERCSELATTKARHARALSVWVEHGEHPAGPPRRR